MNLPQINTYRVEDLFFDSQNPRLAEFAAADKDTEGEILSLLWEAMAVDEIVLSIAANGFFPHEQLIITEEIINGVPRKIVVEGNRRLAAVKAILNPSKIKGLINSEVVYGVNPQIKLAIQELPAIKVASREDAWRFIGFKHINGAAKWGSYAKAQYISQIHKEFNINLESIARQIGDTNQQVLKLYQAFRVIKQAEAHNVFDTSDVWGSRLFFSHLSTGLGYEGIQKYLRLDKQNSEYPVPETEIETLGEFLNWLFGSKSKKITPVIQSQNPDLRRLDAVLRSNEATILLRDGASLTYAYEISQPKEDIFEQSLVAAKKELQKANSYSSIAYNGNIEALAIAGDITELAEALYEFLEKKYDAKINKDNPPKKRVTSTDV